MIDYMAQLNKKHYTLACKDGRTMQLHIADMFTVQVMHVGEQVAKVHFQPLSSLNNLEMPPVYRVAEYQSPVGALGAQADALLDAILAVYAFYTRGQIRRGKQT